MAAVFFHVRHDPDDRQGRAAIAPHRRAIHVALETWRTPHRGEEVIGIDVALTSGTNDAGKDLLRSCAAQCAIAATDFALGDNGRAICGVEERAQIC
ncbi:MAG: hypothetical protein ACRD26_10875 [Vicinamibacterales bacterium]